MASGAIVCLANNLPVSSVGTMQDLGKITMVVTVDAAWMTDITYLDTGEGWLYLRAIPDALEQEGGWLGG